MPSLTQTLFDADIGYNLHRPLIGWSVGIIAGTALGFFFGLSLLWLLVATFCVAFAWRGNRRQTALLLFLACLSLTAWRTAQIHDRNATIMTRLIALQEQGETFGLKVVVSNDRQLIQRKRGGPYCRFSVDDAWLDDGTEIHGTNLLVHYYDNSGIFPQTGEMWYLQGKLHKNSWHHRMSLSARGTTTVHLPDEERGQDPQYWFARARNRLAKHLELGVSPDEALLTQTMVLGSRARLPYDARRRYADAGIIHIFAISGLHVGIVAGFLIWFLAWIGVRLRTRALILFPALIGYLILTGVPPSATRACAMALIYCFAPCVLRRPDAPSAFFVTAAGVLLIEPGWIANAGALLSFGVMGGILLYLRPIVYFANRLLRSVPRRTPLGKFPVEMPWHLRFRQGFAAILGLTLSAWLASTPLTLFFFGRVSFIGLILNLFVPTVTLLIVWLACVSAFAGFALTALSVFLNRINAFLLQSISIASDLLIPLPWAVMEIDNRPGITLTLLMEGALIVGGLWIRTIEKRLRIADPLDPETHVFLPEALPSGSVKS